MKLKAWGMKTKRTVTDTHTCVRVHTHKGSVHDWPVQMFIQRVHTHKGSVHDWPVQMFIQRMCEI